jgi:DNA polymerase I
MAASHGQPITGKNAAGGSGLLLVDGHAMAYRAYHAIPRLTSPSGESTNAIWGFVKMLTKIRTALKPDYLAVVWDGGLSAARLAALPEYKAQRPPMPESLERQLPGVESWLGACGIASLRASGVEADDWIGALAVWASAARIRVIIASADKDFMQLVSEWVGLLNPNDKSEMVWTAEQVRQKTGVEPAQIVDWLSLIGDSVDNIPGVPGVGIKTATSLLQRFGSIECIFQRLNEIESETLRERLKAASEVVKRNRELIRLKMDQRVEITLDDLQAKPADEKKLRDLYAGWGFKSLVEISVEQSPQMELF